MATKQGTIFCNSRSIFSKTSENVAASSRHTQINRNGADRQSCVMTSLLQNETAKEVTPGGYSLFDTAQVWYDTLLRKAGGIACNL